MGRKFVFTVCILALAGAAAMAFARPDSKHPTAIRFHGTEGALKRLQAEAASFGFRQWKIEPIGGFLALTVETARIGDNRAACLVEWVFSHPEAKIGFLGNQAVVGKAGP